MNLLGIARISRITTCQYHSRYLSTNSKSSKSYYETLDLMSSASKKEIRDAYIKKSKLCHPDHDPSDPTLHAKFVAVQEAYDVLSSDVKRKEYDLNGTNFQRNQAHPRSSAEYPHHQAPGWGQRPSNAGDPFKDEKPRAFWTDPNYPKFEPRGKSRVFGREIDARTRNKLIASAVFLWMTFGTAFVIIYVRFIYGRREAVLMDRQKRLSAQYQETRDEAYRAKNNREVAELIQEKVKKSKRDRAEKED